MVGMFKNGGDGASLIWGAKKTTYGMNLLKAAKERETFNADVFQKNIMFSTNGGVII